MSLLSWLPAGLVNLSVLDLEANAVSDIDMLLYLQDCAALTHLRLLTNPVCAQHGYRDMVRDGFALRMHTCTAFSNNIAWLVMHTGCSMTKWASLVAALVTWLYAGEADAATGAPFGPAQGQAATSATAAAAAAAAPVQCRSFTYKHPSGEIGILHGKFCHVMNAPFNQEQ